MNISIEKIEELKKRANIGYGEAKKLLEKHDGDIVECLIELEKSKKTYNHQEKAKGFFEKLRKLFEKGNSTKFLITRKDETIANVPVNFLIVALILGFHLMILSLLLVFVTGCKMSIKKSEGSVHDLDDAIIDMANNIKNKEDSKKESDTILTKKTDLKKDSDYKEYTVEN